jgi:hypothetical protein
VPADIAQPVLEVEPSVPPAGLDTEVGMEPTAATGTAGATGKWGEEEGTPPCTSAGNY